MTNHDSTKSIDEWIECIKFSQVNHNSTSSLEDRRGNIDEFNIFRRAIKNLSFKDYVKSDPRLFRMWLFVIKRISARCEAFKFMWQNDICVSLPEYYISFALSLETDQKFDDAEAILRLAHSRSDGDLSELKQAMGAFSSRMSTRICSSFNEPTPERLTSSMTEAPESKNRASVPERQKQILQSFDMFQTLHDSPSTASSRLPTNPIVAPKSYEQKNSLLKWLNGPLNMTLDQILEETPPATQAITLVGTVPVATPPLLGESTPTPIPRSVERSNDNVQHQQQQQQIHQGASWDIDATPQIMNHRKSVNKHGTKALNQKQQQAVSTKDSNRIYMYQAFESSRGDSLSFEEARFRQLMVAGTLDKRKRFKPVNKIVQTIIPDVSKYSLFAKKLDYALITPAIIQISDNKEMEKTVLQQQQQQSKDLFNGSNSASQIYSARACSTLNYGSSTSTHLIRPAENDPITQNFDSQRLQKSSTSPSHPLPAPPPMQRRLACTPALPSASRLRNKPPLTPHLPPPSTPKTPVLRTLHDALPNYKSTLPAADRARNQFGGLVANAANEDTTTFLWAKISTVAAEASLATPAPRTAKAKGLFSTHKQTHSATKNLFQKVVGNSGFSLANPLSTPSLKPPAQGVLQKGTLSPIVSQHLGPSLPIEAIKENEENDNEDFEIFCDDENEDGLLRANNQIDLNDPPTFGSIALSKQQNNEEDLDDFEVFCDEEEDEQKSCIYQNSTVVAPVQKVVYNEVIDENDNEDFEIFCDDEEEQNNIHSTTTPSISSIQHSKIRSSLEYSKQPKNNDESDSSNFEVFCDEDDEEGPSSQTTSKRHHHQRGVEESKTSFISSKSIVQDSLTITASHTYHSSTPTVKRPHAHDDNSDLDVLATPVPISSSASSRRLSSFSNTHQPAFISPAPLTNCSRSSALALLEDAVAGHVAANSFLPKSATAAALPPHLTEFTGENDLIDQDGGAASIPPSVPPPSRPRASTRCEPVFSQRDAVCPAEFSTVEEEGSTTVLASPAPSRTSYPESSLPYPTSTQSAIDPFSPPSLSARERLSLVRLLSLPAKSVTFYSPGALPPPRCLKKASSLPLRDGRSLTVWKPLGIGAFAKVVLASLAENNTSGAAPQTVAVKVQTERVGALFRELHIGHIIRKRLPLCYKMDSFWLSRWLPPFEVHATIMEADDFRNLDLSSLKTQMASHKTYSFELDTLGNATAEEMASSGIIAYGIMPTKKGSVSLLSLLNASLDKHRIMNRGIKHRGALVGGESSVIWVLDQILNMLIALHENTHIIHGDLKPDNFIIAPLDSSDFNKQSVATSNYMKGDPGRLALFGVDFGRSLDCRGLYRRPLENARGFIGSCHVDGFRCTNMAKGNQWLFDCDLYGVSATIYVLATGSYPNDDGSISKSTINSWLPRGWNKALWSHVIDTLSSSDKYIDCEPVTVELSVSKLRECQNAIRNFCQSRSDILQNSLQELMDIVNTMTI